MQNELTVTFEGDYVQVISDGDKDYDFSVRLWSAVVEQCEKHECYDVLGIANTTTPLEAVEGYDQARLFRTLGIGPRYRIAWVEKSPDAVDMASFVETVLKNRGLPGRIFPSVYEAKRWLTGDGDTG